MRPSTSLIAFALAGVMALPLSAHVGPAAAQEAEPFASENAILDTSIPFALGAREARQSLRGSFGWATFQEGLVEGVYFRFDPDGYARFSPSPRLDSDVFEVICRPRTYSCMGRKDSLSLFLTNRGQLQLKFDDVQPGDMFFVSEGISEIQIPERILQPLDQQMEALLATGGELIVRRGDQELANVSLNGYSAVAAYLRWILARQDYSVLPRGWPVPNSANDPNAAGVTQVSEWNSPMPQPQVIAPQYNRFETGPQFNEDVAEVRGELKALRDLLLQRANNAPASLDSAGGVGQPNNALNQELNDRLAELQRQAEAIQGKIDLLQTPQAPQLAANQPAFAQAPQGQPVQPGQATMQYPVAPVANQLPASAIPQNTMVPNTVSPGMMPSAPVRTNPTQVPQLSASQLPQTATWANQMPAPALPASLPATADPYSPPAGPAMGAKGTAAQPSAATAPATNTPGNRPTTGNLGKKLAYLIEEIGLDPQTAMSVLQAQLGELAPDPSAELPQTAAQRTPLYQDDVVSQILSELETELTGGAKAETPQAATAQSSTPAVDAGEYQLLTDYFKSVVVPKLQ